jgi:Flp pilus assembly protein TadG
MSRAPKDLRSARAGARCAGQRGMALVEAAIALPLLLLLLIPVGEITRLFVQYSTLAHHTRSAVRHVAERAINDTTGKPVITPGLTAAARNIIVYGTPGGGGEPLFPGLSIDQVSPPVITAEGNVRLSVTHPYRSLLQLGGRLPGLGFAADLTLKDMPLTVTYTMRPL